MIPLVKRVGGWFGGLVGDIVGWEGEGKRGLICQIRLFLNKNNRKND